MCTAPINLPPRGRCPPKGTEEEYGQKSTIFISSEASSCTLDFAVPLPTSLTLGHLLPGRRFIQETLTDLRMAEIAPFSRRDTWAWEMPREPATSIWVLPS